MCVVPIHFHSLMPLVTSCERLVQHTVPHDPAASQQLSGFTIKHDAVATASTGFATAHSTLYPNSSL